MIADNKNSSSSFPRESQENLSFGMRPKEFSKFFKRKIPIQPVPLKSNPQKTWLAIITGICRSPTNCYAKISVFSQEKIQYHFKLSFYIGFIVKIITNNPLLLNLHYLSITPEIKHFSFISYQLHVSTSGEIDYITGSWYRS